VKTNFLKCFFIVCIFPLLAFQCEERDYVDNAFETFNLKILNVDGSPVSNVVFNIAIGVDYCFYNEEIEEVICLDVLDLETLNILKEGTTDAAGNLKIVHPRQYQHKVLVLNQETIFEFEVGGQVVQRNFVFITKEYDSNFVQNITLISP